MPAARAQEASWPPPQGEPGPQAVVPESRFGRTVLYLQAAPPPLRAEFAVTGLAALAEAYRMEAGLARAEARQSPEAAKLRAWSYAVDQHAQQVEAAMEEASAGEAVQLSLGRDDLLTLIVGNQPVILSHPRPELQRILEQEVLATFCSRHRCESFSPPAVAAEPIPVSAGEVRTQWTFSDTARVCRHGDIAVTFRGHGDLARERFTCDQFMQEISSLLVELGWQQRQGVRIDWDRLAIEATPLRPGHVVVLNAAGESLLATVPLVYSSPRMVERLGPWLRARLSGDTQPPLDIEAADYGWQ